MIFLYTHFVQKGKSPLLVAYTYTPATELGAQNSALGGIERYRHTYIHINKPRYKEKDADRSIAAHIISRKISAPPFVEMGRREEEGTSPNKDIYRYRFLFSLLFFFWLYSASPFFSSSCRRFRIFYFIIMCCLVVRQCPACDGCKGDRPDKSMCITFPRNRPKKRHDS